MPLLWSGGEKMMVPHYSYYHNEEKRVSILCRIMDIVTVSTQSHVTSPFTMCLRTWKRVPSLTWMIGGRGLQKR